MNGDINDHDSQKCEWIKVHRMSNTWETSEQHIKHEKTCWSKTRNGHESQKCECMEVRKMCKTEETSEHNIQHE